MKAIDHVDRPSLLLSLVLGACATSPSPRELDARVRETGAQTIVLGEKLSLYSPDDLVRTRAYLELIEKQRIDVFALFGVDNDRPLVVQLRPNEDLGLELSLSDGRINVEKASQVTEGWIDAGTWTDLVIIEVDPIRVLRLPDGRTLPGASDPSNHVGTIRHELTHVATNLLGLSLDTWLSEGLAHAVELVPIDNGRFDLDPVPAILSAVPRLAHDPRALEALLDWQQGLPATDEDVMKRRLALSFVLFALERDGAPDLREGALRLAARERREFLALGAEWSAWLDALAHASE